jgi:hypothetical protein
MRAFCYVLSVVLSVAIAGAASAQDSQRRSKVFGIGAIGGTLGAGAEASLLIHSMLVLRGNATVINFNSLDWELNPSSENSFALSGTTVGAIVDWHPFKSGWRLSGGTRYVAIEGVAATRADSTGSKIGNRSYNSADIGTWTTKIGHDGAFAPYFGFGYDSAHYDQNDVGFSLGFDFGAAYLGPPKVTSTTEKSVAGLGADLEKETKEIEDDLSKFYTFYPVVMFNAKLSF